MKELVKQYLDHGLDRGAAATTDEAQAIAAYLTANFGAD